uniref:Uncharacterized protein n=1 Tax=Cucumis melo TaxID=3656 RepID=A0A9I9E828_CUCME
MALKKRCIKPGKKSFLLDKRGETSVEYEDVVWKIHSCTKGSLKSDTIEKDYSCIQGEPEGCAQLPRRMHHWSTWVTKVSCVILFYYPSSYYNSSRSSLKGNRLHLKCVRSHSAIPPTLKIIRIDGRATDLKNLRFLEAARINLDQNEECIQMRNSRTALQGLNLNLRMNPLQEGEADMNHSRKILNDRGLVEGIPRREEASKEGVEAKLFYKPSDIRVASYVCWEGFRGFLCVVFHVEYSISKIGSAGIVRGDDICWLHAVFRAKTVGGPGGSESCHHLPADDTGRIRMGRRILLKVNLKGDLVPRELVETALRVEQSIVEEKSAMELSRGVSTTSGIRGREQRRFTPGVNVSGCQDFKRRSGGKPLRQMSSGTAYQRQSQRASSQSANSVARSRTMWINRTFQEGLSTAESSSSEGPGS